MSYKTGDFKKKKTTKKGSLLSFGNKQMTIPIFNIPAVSTCPGKTEACKKYCYAKSSEELFPTVLVKRKECLAATKKADFVDVMIKEIKAVPFIPYFRIHESGDFYNQAYFDKWVKIAAAIPEKKFLAFTKNNKLDISKRPANLIIYQSVWFDSNPADIIKGVNKAITVMDFKWSIAKGLDKAHDVSNAKQCSGFCDECLHCFNNEGSVWFPIHGHGKSK